jgi:hypothetical protein
MLVLDHDLRMVAIDEHIHDVVDVDKTGFVLGAFGFLPSDL